jgi:peptidoglycan hydrolase-like protein with peptidoglycan-binding domain
MNRNKLVSAALTATTLLWMVGATALPVASAQTTSSLQAQIAALLAQITALQGQLNASGSMPATSMTYDFTTDLTIGSTGSQVSALQQLLISKGYLTAVSAPTGYFGALTQSALAQWQASVGITPSVGYFGPKTRAFINAMSSTTTTTTTGTGTTTTVTTTAPATGLSVGLASTNPAAGSLISSANSGSARVPVLSFNLTAGNSGAVTVSGLTFQKTGVLSDSAISGAYITQNGQVLAQYNSLNSGTLNFSGLSWSIPAGQTETFTLAIDVSSGLSAGNTTGFSLSSVTAWDTNNTAITPTGALPLLGNTFTVTTVTNPSLATLTITSSSIGTSQTAGTQGNVVGSYNFIVANSPVWLENLNFHVIGSANDANLQNVKLLVNGVQVGATLSAVGSNNMADFSATSTGIKLNTGSNNVQVVADIMGSPSDYFQFEILNGYDVLAVDSQYNVPIQVTNTGGIGTAVNIEPGFQHPNWQYCQGSIRSCARKV